MNLEEIIPCHVVDKHNTIKTMPKNGLKNNIKITFPLQRFEVSQWQHYKCLRCELFFKTREQFERHQCASGFQCYHCFKHFETFTQVSDHEQKSHSNIKEENLNPSYEEQEINLGESEENIVQSIYKCTLCQLDFAQEHLKQLHSCKNGALEIKEKNRTCRFCNIVYSTEEILQKHLYIHEIMAFVCFSCGVCFQSSENLSQHVRNCPEKIEPPVDVIYCTDCQNYFDDVLSYNIHFCFTCNICKKVVTNIDDIILHTKFHGPRDKDDFEYVDENQASLETIEVQEIIVNDAHEEIYEETLENNIGEETCQNEEIKREKVEQKTFFKCNKCRKTFIKLKSLFKHYKLFKKLYFVCTICQTNFNLRSHCYQHLKTKHKALVIDKSMIKEEFKLDCGQRNIVNCKETNIIHNGKTIENNEIQVKTNESTMLFMCVLCNLKFPQKKLVLRHLLFHENVNYNCAYCPKRFNTKFNLTVHLREKHPQVTFTAIKKYLCDVSEKFIKEVWCNGIKEDDKVMKNVPKSESLVNKNKLYSCRNKDFQCNVCNEIFTLKIFLKEHIVRHKREFPFVCSICFEIFNTKKLLFDHKKLWHNSEDKLKLTCKNCGKIFKMKKMLQKHHFVDQCCHTRDIYKN